MAVILGAALLACLAIACLPWSSIAAKVVLVAAICTSLAALASVGQEWAFLFALAACGCCVGGAWFLFFRTERWVHRFVIYTGYGATFAVMGAASGRGWGIFALTGIWVLGSAAIFAAKSLTVRWAVCFRALIAFSIATSGMFVFSSQGAYHNDSQHLPVRKSNSCPPDLAKITSDSVIPCSGSGGRRYGKETSQG